MNLCIFTEYAAPYGRQSSDLDPGQEPHRPSQAGAQDRPGHRVDGGGGVAGPARPPRSLRALLHRLCTHALALGNGSISVWVLICRFTPAFARQTDRLRKPQ